MAIASYIQVGMVGLEFRPHFVDQDGSDLDISAATTKTLRFTSPVGTSTDVTAGFLTTGTDGRLSYTTTATTELDEYGEWEVQPYVSDGGGLQVWGPVYTFEVHENLDAP